MLEPEEILMLDAAETEQLLTDSITHCLVIVQPGTCQE
jgi:hypothetical protein